jgi:sigma-B regulation protein RsbU (phosphoserine phosphatase)
MATLNILKGVSPGKTFPLDRPRMVIGRQETCDIVLNVPAVSREHAVIHLVQGKFYLEDLKSRNKTFVNNQEVNGKILLKDNDRIKICDNLMAFQETAAKPALPTGLLKGAPERDEDDRGDEESSSTVEATISQSSKQLLETQPAERLAFLLNIVADLTQTLDMDELLPKVGDSLFQVFRQADRGFIILAEDGKLIPKVIKTRHGDDASARFSRTIINKCLQTGQAFLSEDAGKNFDMSQSIADCKIRSVMCVPVIGRNTEKAFGVIQLDTQDRHKKFNEDDLKLLLAVAGQAAVAMENATMHRSLVARATLENDLKTATSVQKSFLPKKPPSAEGYEFYAHYESAQEVGGDYYDFVPLPGGKWAVMVGDVAGKGVPAALLMAKVSSDARFTLLTEPALAETVYKLNELLQEAGMLDRFVTLGACLLDPATNQVTCASAGHMPPIIYRKASGKVEEATPRDLAGLPLGVADGIPYESATVTLDPGDTMLLYTDGITEAKNKQEAEFQMEGIYTALKAGPMTPQAMGERLVTAVKKHFVGCKQHDDITVVCFGRV